MRVVFQMGLRLERKLLYMTMANKFEILLDKRLFKNDVTHIGVCWGRVWLTIMLLGFSVMVKDITRRRRLVIFPNNIK
jgi:hypothetical protein